MKKLLYAVCLLLLCTVSAAGGYFAGRAGASGPACTSLYATVESIDGDRFVVEGLAVNDINGRGRFSFTADGETKTEWHNTAIHPSDLWVGSTIEIVYTGDVLEISPAVLQNVIKIRLLDDELGSPKSEE